MNNGIALTDFHGPAADRLLIKKQAPKYHGHFLSIIAFDGNITMQTFQSVLEAQSTKRLWRGWKNHAGEGQGRSRNECAHRFLHDTDCEFHNIVDADLMFVAKHWESLRKHPEAKDSIIVGAYPKKQEAIEFCLNTLRDGPKEPNARGLMEVAKGGTGFMQIPRSVYERVAAAYPERNYVCDYEKGPNKEQVIKHAWFCECVMMDEDVGWVRHLTEDWMFCYWARKCGVKIYVDFSTATQPWIQHRGSALFPLPCEIERNRVQAELDKANAELVRLRADNAELVSATEWHQPSSTKTP